MVDTELKPCPFCGGEKLETYKADEEMYAVYCDGCNVSGPAYSDPDSTQPHEAIELWNTRRSPVTPEEIRVLDILIEDFQLGFNIKLYGIQFSKIQCWNNKEKLEKLRAALKEII